jgi:hypothetical protein
MYKLYNDTAGTITAYRYDKPIHSNVKQIKDIKPIKKKKSAPSGLVRVDNATRSQNLLIDYIRENEHIWTTFITLTFAENVTDINTAMKELNKYTSKLKRVYPQFAYAGSIEPQQRGAWHFHMLTNLKAGSKQIPRMDLKRIWNPKSKKWLDMYDYDLPYWNAGYSTAFDIENDTDSKFNTTLYITQYLTKGDMSLLAGRKKVLKSNNLKKPRIYKLSENSQIAQELNEYIAERKQLAKEKHILAPNKYAPNISIYTFTAK